MQAGELLSLEQIRAFLAASDGVQFEGRNREEVYGWVDEAHETLSRPATQKLFQRAFHDFGDRRHERVAQLSVAHLYRLRGRMLKVAFSSRGAWHLAATGSLQTALANAVLRRYAFLMPSELAVP